MQLETGLGGGFALAQWPGTEGTAAGAAFGVSAGGGGVEAQASTTATGFLSVGTLALVALLFVWWSLPE